MSWGELTARAEALLPGPELVALLASIEAPADPVWLVGQWNRIVSWAQARSLAEMATLVSERSDELDWRAAQADLALELGIGEMTAGGQLALAHELVNDLPDTLAAMGTGEVTLAKARLIAEQTAQLDPADRSGVEQHVLPVAAGLTCTALRRRVRTEVLRLDPDAVLRRRERCETDRYVRLSPPDPDGMATLSAYLTHDQGLRALTAVDTHARQQDCNHADAFLALLTGDQAPAVQLLIRTDGEASTANGEPLDQATLRELVKGAAKVTIRPIHAPTAETRYRPSQAMRDYVVATHPTCRFPHCSRDSQHCDLDHVIPYDTGGQTSAHNLIPLCRNHHRLKTHRNWKPKLHPDNTVSWTDPRGNDHLDPPPE